MINTLWIKKRYIYIIVNPSMNAIICIIKGCSHHLTSISNGFDPLQWSAMAGTAAERLLSHAAMAAVRLWAGDLDPEFLPCRAANDTWPVWPGNFTRWGPGALENGGIPPLESCLKMQQNDKPWRFQGRPGFRQTPRSSEKLCSATGPNDKDPPYKLILNTTR